uniref:GLUG motif-containing protein n=1 Tax=Gemmiger formicilis TaxID=745368 RepID=UPI004028D8B7
MIHKTTRSILSVLLAALLLVTSTPLTPAFADGGAVSLQSESAESRELPGDGTEGNPYKIATADDLLEFADKVNNQGQISAWAELTADIDLSSVCSEEKGTWTPIGTSSSRYSGTFNGANYTISGLNIKNTSSDTDYQGLFGFVDSEGTVQNLTVSGNVSGNNYIGGVVGYNGGTVENCYNTGSVKGNSYVGGVVGYNSGLVKNCYNTGSVSGPDSGTSNYVGGVVGYNYGGRVENCYNTGAVSGSGNRVGGVVGYNSGVVGLNSGGNVENCYNTGSVNGSAASSNVGGVVGRNDGTVKNCYNTGKVTGSSSVGGVVGYNSGPESISSGTVTGCYFLKQNPEIPGIGNDSSVTGATVVTSLNVQDQFKGWDFSDTWRISQSLGFPVLQDNAQDGLPPGLGTEASPYEISTADELENFRNLVNNGIEKSAHAKLMNDINLNGNTTNQWIPIGNSIGNSYEGTFNGDGHTISGLYIDSSDTDYQGLFGYLGTSGDNKGTVQNLSVSGSVSGHWYVGGVVGYNNGGNVTGCIFSGSGTVSGGMYVGGVVGENRGSVENCYNTGAVSGPDSGSGNSVGGVVGYNYHGTVENCYNTGTVSGSDSGSGNSVGGVVGYNHSGTVKNCYNTGEVSGPDNGTSNYVGGVVGYNRGSVTNCYNTDSVTVTGSVSDDWYVGGVVGYNNGGSITNCYYQIDKGATVGIGNETTADTSKAEGKTDAQFASGEVAHLLEQNVADSEKPVWGQTLGGEEDSLPTLVALNPDAAKKVYQLTFDWRYEGAPEGTTTTTNVYTNGSVAIPEINHDRAGYHISGWKDASGAPVTTETAVTADT